MDSKLGAHNSLLYSVAWSVRSFAIACMTLMCNSLIISFFSLPVSFQLFIYVLTLARRQVVPLLYPARVSRRTLRMICSLVNNSALISLFRIEQIKHIVGCNGEQPPLVQVCNRNPHEVCPLCWQHWCPISQLQWGSTMLCTSSSLQKLWQISSLSSTTPSGICNNRILRVYAVRHPLTLNSV